MAASRLCAPQEADPTAGLATSKILLFDRRDRVNTCGNDIHLTGLTFCRGLGADAAAYAAPEEVAAVSGAAFLIRRALLDALGGFAERFFMYHERHAVRRIERPSGEPLCALVLKSSAFSIGMKSSSYVVGSRCHMPSIPPSSSISHRSSESCDLIGSLRIPILPSE